MIGFIEKNTGAKYDFEKVKAVVEETNKQYEIWKEVNEYMKASPAPMPSFCNRRRFLGVNSAFAGRRSESYRFDGSRSRCC